MLYFHVYLHILINHCNYFPFPRQKQINWFKTFTFFHAKHFFKTYLYFITTLNPQVMQDFARLRAVQSKREFIYNIALDIHINSDQAERCRAGRLHAHTPLCTVCHTSTHKCSELGNVKSSRDEFKVKLMMVRLIH